MKELFANTEAGMMGLIIFFVFFCGVLIWVMRPGTNKRYENYGEIPLREDDKNDQ